MKLLSGIVNRDKEHIDLLYGDLNKLDPKDFISVALVAPRPSGGFTIQYTLVVDDADARMMVKEVQEELEFYLVQKCEPDPWLYAHYNCGSTANWYSRTHWSCYSRRY